MNTFEKKLADHNAIKKHQELIVSANIWRTCLNCENWNPKENLCDKFDQLPPPNIILNSCHHWERDIPF